MKTKNEDEKAIAHMAQKSLSDLILNKHITLKNTSIDKYGRILANVYIEKWY